MKILVWGFFFKKNFGDQFFIEAYQHLFPDFTFTFTDCITKDNIAHVDAVFFGGGSFLFAEPKIDADALSILQQKKIFYMGVGGETDIGATHQLLISKAQYIACRSPGAIDKLKAINPNTEFVPDLVYALQSQVKPNPNKYKNSVLILPNVSVVPRYSDPHWQHAAWAYFKSEFSQFLDWLVSDQKCDIKFMSMCQSNDTHDDLATAELIAHMDHRNHKRSVTPNTLTFKDTASYLGKFDAIITQRFHGIVLAEMTGNPYIAIHHHDKLIDTSPKNGAFLSYYNVNKKMLRENFQTLNMQHTSKLPIDPNVYRDFVKKINSLL
jgi:polysaccharide pyruvyl transferase WcaK-like protein